MITKYLPRGSGSIDATFDYLLGKDRDRDGASVLRGNPELTRQLTNSLDFKNRYTVGVHSFFEQDLPHDIKQEIMNSYENTMFAGLDRDQYDICWIQHLDKGRLELNIVIPKVELESGRAMNPYYDAVDRDLADTWKDYINAKYDLHDPNDPANIDLTAENQRLPADKKEIKAHIDNGLLNLCKAGELNSRADVVKTLERAGFEIARTTPTSISIKDPAGGRNIRLKGAIYDEKFTGLSKELRADIERASERYRESRTARLSELGAKLDKLTQAKREYNQQRFGRERTADARQNQEIVRPQAIDRGRDGVSSVANRDFNASAGMARQDANRASERAISHRASNPSSTSAGSSTSESENWQKRRWDDLDRASQAQKSPNWQAGQWHANHDFRVTDYAKRLFSNVRKLIERARATIERVRADNQAERRDNQTERADNQPAQRADRAIDSTERAIIDSKQQLEQSKQAVADLSQQAQAVADRGMSR